MVYRHRLYTPEDDVRETPPSFFEPLHAARNYTIDACANASNAKVDLFYSLEGLCQREKSASGAVTCTVIAEGFTGLTGLYPDQRVWCNPPFSDFDLWLPWAWEHSEAELITMLVPATRTERPWWQKWVEPYRDGQPERRGTDPGYPVGWRLHTDCMPKRIQFLEDGHPIWRKNKDGSPRLLKSGIKKGQPEPSVPMFGITLLEWRHEQ